MTDLILNGACGRMGRAVAEAAASAGVRVVAGVDPFEKPCDFPLYRSLDDVTECADVLVDFTVHTSTPDLLRFAERTGTPMVVATTGHTPDELDALHRISAQCAILHSGNMSLGVHLLISLCRQAATVLGGKADVEIIEKHHNQKLDAPSGTALMIAHAIREALPGETDLVYDRTDRRCARPKAEIGISSIRGGNIVGEHEVLFCCGDEVVSVKHTAIGRTLFAQGALRAAEFLKGKQSGFYTMEDLLRDALQAPAKA